MKILKKQPIIFDVNYIIIRAHVRYWEDSFVNGKMDDPNNPKMPCVDGEYWCPVIDVNSGCIINWEKGVTAQINYKVCDEFSYRIEDTVGRIVDEFNDIYVPGFMSIEDAGYGDYIIINVDENGYINNWNSKYCSNIIQEQITYNEVDDEYL